MKSLINSKITALYGRLSQEDEQEGDSVSVINQKKILEDYARKNGFQNLRYYSDDGYTGTNFNRPGFQKMMKDIEHGEISTVIVKDMSRLGRNYLEVGYYTEVLFPSKGIRFLAINNGIDSNNPRENEFAPFINIMNEWYARDTSNKIRSVFNNRMQDGKRCSGAVPYGYMKKPDDKQTFFIDPEAAPVVKRIFEMTAEGYGTQQIADILREERILCPAAHSEKNGLKVNTSRSDDYAWNITGIHRILDQKQYLGHTVLHKSVKDNFKTKIPHKVDEEDQYVFYNTHEAIISQDLWDRAQSLRVKKTNTPMSGKVSHRLSGLVYCSECGSKLFYSSCEWKERMGEVLTMGARYFQCSGVHKKKTQCKSHHIPAVILEDAVADAIHGIIQFVLKDEAEFAAKVMEQWQKEKGKESSFEESEYKRLLKRNDELSLLISKLFESTQLGTLPERQAQRMIVQYDEEQVANEEKIAALEKTISKRDSVKADPKRFIDLVKKYKDCTDITDAILYAFIDKIVVHETDERLKPFKYKKIDIYFNFIGNFLTEPEPSFEELKAELERLDFEKKVEAKKRYAETRKAKRQKLAELSESDPEAYAIYEQHRQAKCEVTARKREKMRERAAIDPEYAAEMKRKQDEYNKKHSEIQKEVTRQTSPRALQRAWDEAHPEEAAQRKAEHQRELWRKYDKRKKEKVNSDPVRLEEYKRKQHEKYKRVWQNVKQHMTEDPEFAEEYKRKKAEGRKKQYEAHKARMAADPEYAAAYKAKQSVYRKTWAEKQKMKGSTSEEKGPGIEEPVCAT